MLKTLQKTFSPSPIFSSWLNSGVDFIVKKSSVYRKTEFERRRKVKFGNITLWIASIEDIIISKLFWAKESLSEMQLNDVKNLYNSSYEIDTNYLESWINKLNLNAVYKMVQV